MAENPIQNCRVRFEFKCPKQWEALQETTEAGVRFCVQCAKHVYLCQSMREASQHARADHCVALPVGLVTPEDSQEERERVEALAREHGVPSIQLNGHEIDPDMFRLVPLDFARRYGLVPLRQVGNALMVAMVDPRAPHALDDLKFLTGGDVEVVVASRRDIREILDRADLEQSAVPSLELGSVCCEDEPEPDTFEGMAGKIIRNTLLEAHRLGDEQIHVEITDSAVVIGCGLPGNWRPLVSPPYPLRHELVRQLRHAVSSLPGHEGQLHFQTRGERIAYAVRFNPTALGEEVILRRLCV